MRRELTVDLFRYQLLPTTGKQQLTLFGNRSPRTPEEARERKNEYFAICLRELPPMFHRGRELATRMIADTGNLFAFRLGMPKDVERITQDLQSERIESYPNVVVAINNDPDVQLIGISRDRKAFSSPTVPLKILGDTLGLSLHEFSLAIHIEALFETSEFWALVREYEARVTAVRFELVSPNMANISGSLELDLVGLNRASNSHQTNLELNSPKDGVLELEESNPMLNSLVEYSSQGGGDVSLKVRGLRKRVRTSRSTRCVEIDEVAIDGRSDAVAEVLAAVLSDD